MLLLIKPIHRYLSIYSTFLISELRDQILGYRFDNGIAKLWGYSKIGKEKIPDEEDTDEKQELALPTTVTFESSSNYGQSINYGPTHHVVLTQICCGNSFAIFLSNKLEVYSIGSNSHGCLGIGAQESFKAKAVKISQTDEGAPFIDITNLSVGACHCMALSKYNRVYSWGCGNSGRLGHGNNTRELKPKEIKALEKLAIIFISAGFSHSAAISSQNNLFTWGCGSQGKLGHGFTDDDPTPQIVDDLKEVKIIFVSCGFDHTLCICKSDN